MPEESAEAVPSEPAPAAKKPRRWRRKLLVFFVSLSLTLGLLEVVARLFMPGVAPVRVGDGFYDNPLPLVTSTGGSPVGLEFLPTGERLPEAKRDGEIRIFVMGESSVAGSPFDLDLSPPAMLKNILERRLPGRDVTVVGMGRPGSIAANTLYYLFFLRRLSPDYVVFFMGMNDGDYQPGETCMLGTSPVLHAAWRAVAGHSWAIWLTRVYGPNLLWKLTQKKDWYPPRDCEIPTFALWTRLLVQEVVDMGARPVVVTPVRSAAQGLEPKFRGDEKADLPVAEGYRALLASLLSGESGFERGLRAALESSRLAECEQTDPDSVSLCKRWTDLFQHRMGEHDRVVGGIAKAWEAAVNESGGDYVPFHRLLEDVSPERLLATAYFTDRQHLTPAGYYWVAALAAERIVAHLTGSPAAPVDVPDEDDVAEWVRRSRSSGIEIELEQLARGWYLTGALGLLYTARTFVPGACELDRVCEQADMARLAVGWLRRKAGLDPGLSPELAARLADFDPKVALDEVRRRK